MTTHLRQQDKLNLIHQFLNHHPRHVIDFFRHGLEGQERVGLLPDPGGLVPAAGLCLEQAQGVAASGDELEHFLNMAHNSNSLDHQVCNIRMGVKTASRDPHDNVWDLPPAVPVVGDFHEDRGVAR